MGTRGTITFIFRGKKIKVYNHWDSYPEGLGVDLVNELKILLNNLSIDEIIEKFNNIKIFTYDSMPSKEEIEKLKKYSDTNVSSQNLNDVYCLLRKTQGSIIKILDAQYVINHDGDECCNYIVDFDEQKFSMIDTPIEYDFDKLDDFLNMFNEENDYEEEEDNKEEENKEEKNNEAEGNNEEENETNDNNKTVEIRKLKNCIWV